jgi:protein required for attachment to host cells
VRNWLVVANAARARILEEADSSGTYVHRADLVHTQSRQKGTDLGSDRAGHMEGSSQGLAGVAYQPHPDVRDREHERFAREVAATLNDAVARGQCAGLVLVASNPFLGHLKKGLGAHARKAVLRTVPSDYTSLADSEIARRLADAGD